MSQNVKNVVVTGLGIISSAGFSVDGFFDNLCDGKDMSGPITSFNTDGFRRKYAAEIKEELPKTPKKWEGYGRTSKMALLAVSDALTDAGLDLNLSEYNTGLCIGNMTGASVEFENWYCDEENNEVTEKQKNLIKQLPNKAVAQILANEFKVRGCVNTIVSACASSTIALGIAYKLIKRGRADIVICGGVDSFRKMQHLEASAFRIVSPEKVTPFDAKRKGILLGEGAGILVFESEESAKKRNARIHCRVLGFGSSCDAYDLAHPQENGEGISLSMEKAIKSAGIPKEKIGYINAHGTGTVKNDPAEILGIKRAFGAHAKNLLISSIKGSLGHTQAADGAIEAIATVMAVIKGRIPPTINYNNYDENCDLNIVPNKAVDVKLETAASNSFGFGGNNATIIFGEYDKNE